MAAYNQWWPLLRVVVNRGTTEVDISIFDINEEIQLANVSIIAL